MAWETLRPNQKGQVKKCVKYAAKIAKSHEKHLGTTDPQHDKVSDKFCEKMRPSQNDGVRYLEVMYLDDYQGGEVALFFQKMKWLSKFASPTVGDIWVLTVVFKPDGAIFHGKDQDYIDFLDMLNEKPANDGPLQTFMKDHGVSSLFSVGPIGEGIPDKGKEISWLEYVARKMWTPKNGAWKVMAPIKIDETYVGSTGTAIPARVLKYWGKYSDNKFALTEMRFSP